MPGMRKSRAFELLGTSKPTEVARLVRVTPQAVYAWPEELSDAIADRVVAAVARRLLPAALIGDEAPAALPSKVA